MRGNDAVDSLRNLNVPADFVREFAGRRKPQRPDCPPPVAPAHRSAHSENESSGRKHGDPRVAEAGSPSRSSTRNWFQIAIAPISAANKKSLARNTRRIKPNPFSRRVRAAAAWEGVLTYGVSPITVAGPWPIFTAFPTSQTCWMSKAVYGAEWRVSTWVVLQLVGNPSCTCKKPPVQKTAGVYETKCQTGFRGGRFASCTLRTKSPLGQGAQECIPRPSSHLKKIELSAFLNTLLDCRGRN